MYLAGQSGGFWNHGYLQRCAVSASGDNTLKVWDLESGLELQTLAGHSAPVSGVAVTADGRRAVSASWDDTLKVWDVESGHELRRLAGPSDGVALTADGRRAVSASGDNTLKVWDVESGQELRTLAGHSDSVRSVALTADGRRAVSASRDNTLKVWDLERGTALAGFTCEGVSACCAVSFREACVTPDSFDHTGFPKGHAETLASGWNAHYWEPLAKFFA